MTEVRQRFGRLRCRPAHRVPGHRLSANSPTLRRALRDAGGEYKVYKNTSCASPPGIWARTSIDQLTGPTAIAFVPRTVAPVAVAKALAYFAKANPALVVKGGLLGDKGWTRPRWPRRWPTWRPARSSSPGWPAASPPRCGSFAGLLAGRPA